MDLHEAAERWTAQLEIADNLLLSDPTAARDLDRAVVSAIERWSRSSPLARHRLEPLLVRARAALARTEAECRRFQHQAAVRERQVRARERAAATLPMAALRKPWPGGDRRLTS